MELQLPQSGLVLEGLIVTLYRTEITSTLLDAI